MTEWIPLIVIVSLIALCAILALSLRERARLDTRLIDKLADKVCVPTELQIERIRHEAAREAMAMFREMNTPAPGAPEPIVRPEVDPNVRSM